MIQLQTVDRIKRAGVAVSGGADSVFLLYALHDRGLAAAVLHVNHRLRGSESDRDEAFVRDLASRLGMPVHVLNAPLAPGNIEQEARRARYGFFAECMAAGICDTVATGHTLDDQAETVLARFLRGSGTAGLSGILPATDAGIVRPLLGLRRAEIREWLTAQGIGWQEDCSNADPGPIRNRLRLDLMPQLAALNPSLPETLAATADWAQAEERFWVEEIDRIATDYLVPDGAAILVELTQFSGLAVAVQRRLLRRGIKMVRGSLRGVDFRHVEAIRAMMAAREGSGRMQLPDLDAYRSFDWLRLAPVGYDTRLERNFQTPLLTPGRTRIPERLLTIEVELVTLPHVYNKQWGALNFGAGAGPLVLRNWRPGDRLNSEKIKTLFQEHRIPLWQRRNWPVITLGDSVVWTRQFGVATHFAPGPGSECILLVRETTLRQPGESKGACAASVTVVGEELQRVGSRSDPVSGERSAEAS
ncbi:MAG: tRNA lysidine(34) synthetase TilS [Terriglobia bacterium]